MRESFLERLGKSFVPRRFRPNIRKFFAKAGYKTVPYKTFGLLFYVVLAITLVTYIAFIYPKLSQHNVLLVVLLTFAYWVALPLLIVTVFGFGFYFITDLKIYKRVKAMEKALPDYLDLVVANMKGGMNFDQALWAAIRPEFGVLAEEMTITSKKVLTGTEMEEAFKELSEKYESPTMRRAFELIIGEIGVGGNIIPVIERVVQDLRETRELREELASTTLAYIIFISTIVMVIAPALFALSFQLVKTIVSISQSLGQTMIATGGQGLGFLSSSKLGGVDLKAYKTFSVLTLTITATAAGMITSVIKKGEIKGGLKYSILYILVSILDYLLFVQLLSGLFANVIPG